MQPRRELLSCGIFVPVSSSRPNIGTIHALSKLSVENGYKNAAAKQLPLWLHPAVPTIRSYLNQGAPNRRGLAPRILCAAIHLTDRTANHGYTLLSLKWHFYSTRQRSENQDGDSSQPDACRNPARCGHRALQGAVHPNRRGRRPRRPVQDAPIIMPFPGESAPHPT